jgi:MarR family transcriptional regulator, organic hydroperoxide resistance regulator
MDTNEFLKLENQLCFSIYATSRSITKIYRPFLDELDITYPQYLVMLVLWEKGSITLKELGRKLYLDSGTLTPLLKRLEHMGLVKRERLTEDERILSVSLTEKGINLKHDAIKIPSCILNTLNMDLESLVAIKKSLDELLHNINKNEDNN